MTPSPIDSSVMRACSLPRPSEVSRLLRCVMSRATVRSAGSPPNVMRRLCSSAHSALLVVADELHLERRQRLALAIGAADVLAHDARYAGRNRSVIGLPTSVLGIDAEQLARRAIGVQDRARVDQRDLGQRVRQRVEQLVALAARRRLGCAATRAASSLAIEQAVHRCRDVDERAQAAVDGESARRVRPTPTSCADLRAGARLRERTAGATRPTRARRRAAARRAPRTP